MNSAIYSLFISMALRVTVITAFVMLIKLIFRQKLSAAAHCGIWIIPVVQVIFCIGNVSIPARTSIYNVVEGVAVSAGTIAAQQPEMHIDVRNIIALIYCIGTAALALWYLTVFLLHRYRTSKLDTVDDETSLRILGDLKAMLGIGDDIKLRRGEFAQTLRDTVILPDGYSPDEQRQIMLHELCHYKNKDNIKLLIAAAVICLNWFNPVVWLAFKRFRSDIEMYCDDNVMKLTESKKEYAMVLVKTAAEHTRFIPGATGVSNSKHEVARRVRRIASWKKKKPVWLIAAVCACVTVSSLCLTDAVSTAVENTVDVAATPEPVEVVPAIIDTVTQQSTPEPTEAASETEQPVYPDTRTQSISAQDTQESGTVRESIPADTQSSGSVSYVPPAETADETNAVAETDTAVSEQTAAEPETETVPPEEDIYSSLGEPESVSANGNKETYSLDDGRTAVLHYDGGELETGYIISGGETAESGSGTETASEPAGGSVAEE